MAEEDVKTAEAEVETGEDKEAEVKAGAKEEEGKAPDKTWAELLAEFKEGEAEEEPKKEAAPAPKKEAPELPKQIQEMMADYNQRVAERNQGDLVKDLMKFETGLKDYPEELVKALAIGQMVIHGDLEQAFNQRAAKGATWNSVGKALAGELRGALSTLNVVKKEAAAEDAEEGTSQVGRKAAGRAQENKPTRSTAQKEADERVMGMSNAERIAEWRKQGINLGL